MTDNLISKEVMRIKSTRAGIIFFVSGLFFILGIITINSYPLFGFLLLLISITGEIYFLRFRFQIHKWKKDPDLRILFDERQVELKETRNQLRQTKFLAVKYDVGLEHLGLSGSYTLSTNQSGLVLKKSLGKESTTINWSDLLEVESGSEADLRNRVTLSRVLLTGIFALAIKKERKKGFFISIAMPMSVGLFEVNTAGRDNRANEKKARVFAAACNARIRAAVPKYLIANSVISGLSYGDIEKLGELLSKGLITEEEFNLKKKQILGI